MDKRARAQRNIVDVLSERASSEALAYVFLADGTCTEETRWTFAETVDSSVYFAAHLRDRGIRRGDRVILALNPGLEYVAALYGLMWLGAVPVPCFPPLRPKELERFDAVAHDCTPRAIVIDGMFADRMAVLRGRLASAGHDPAIVHGVPEGMTVTRALPPAEVGDIAMIQYTSGSTGSPKGVCLTHDNLASNCEALDRSMGWHPERVGLSWLPPYHDMGLIGTIMLSMYHGWPLVMMSPGHFVQQPRRWLQAITDYRVTTTVGPNFSLDMCSDAVLGEELAGLDLSTVRQLYCGAEPNSAETLARFEQTFAPVGFDGTALIPCYGMAEATLFVSGKRAGSRHRTAPKPAGAGRVVVSCGDVDGAHTVRIVDTSSMTALPDNLVGEIWVSGPNVAVGYHNRPDATSEVFDAALAGDGRRYLRTGDLGFMCAGELYVTGRIKDLIIVDGRNIYPQDVEAAAVRADPAVGLAVAFALEGNSTERVCVVAEAAYRDVSAHAYRTLAEAIRAGVAAELGVRPHVHLCPRRTIPTTTSGKVRRQEARRMFLAGGLRSLPIQSIPVQR